jgi:hypothetical protein
VKRSLTLAALTSALALGATGVQAGDPASEGAKATTAGCKTVHYGGRSYVLYRKGRVRCLFAKRWVRRLNRSRGDNSPPGWACESGTNFRTGGACSKGRRAFGWHPAD